MTVKAHTLRAAANILGWDEETLQSRLREGAFPGRYLVETGSGPQLVIPHEDVLREAENRTAVNTTTALVPRDDAVGMVLTREREAWLQRLESLFAERDAEIAELRRAVEKLASVVEPLEARGASLVPLGPLSDIDDEDEVDSLMSELESLEELLAGQ